MKYNQKIVFYLFSTKVVFLAGNSKKMKTLYTQVMKKCIGSTRKKNKNDLSKKKVFKCQKRKEKTLRTTKLKKYNQKNKVSLQLI